MKITKSKLKQIIKEELESVLRETAVAPASPQRKAGLTRITIWKTKNKGAVFKDLDLDFQRFIRGGLREHQQPEESDLVVAEDEGGRRYEIYREARDGQFILVGTVDETE